ncbi:hypothetical protein [Agrobacterium larrymoorei]|uniref:DUF1127 domain-containing protein n=1 Tax=Agrobacterium larrymoorei TaxID=160699 RepID=A0AAF0KCM7_9HYPH|nr:hypothetical protein [Agrobacterium larrymoorei]WHA39791.1 hypothetical protein CFBP5477_007970 [Agrobacterium larrymoorei]
MTMITYHGESGSSLRRHSSSWLSRLVGLGTDLYASWRRRQNLRVLENLPADTLKDIGWPTTDNKRMRIVRK